MAKRWDVFISYSKVDQEFVAQLSSRLKRDGFSVFYDQAEIVAGDSIVNALSAAIRSATHMLVIMSPAYFESRWTVAELDLALSEEFEEGRVKVIPILSSPCEIPPLLRSKLYADFTAPDAMERQYPRLIGALKGVAPHLPHARRDRSATPSNPPFSLGALRRPKEDRELRAMLVELQAKVDSIMTTPSVATAPLKQEAVTDTCFVVMPFGSDDLNDVYEYFIKPSLESNCNVRCVRGDDVFGSNIIMDDIRHSIAVCRLVVADLTGRNANVFYEVGIAHTLEKDVLLLAQSMNDVPFDLRHRRVLLYEFTPRGCKKLEKTVAENVSAILGLTA
jgi:TIR domain